MSEIPRIALFRADPKDEEKLLRLFQRHEYSVRSVSNAAEILSLIEEEDASFDVIVVPLRLVDQSSGISACLQVKSHEALASVPLLGIANSQEKAVIQTFYEAGADTILISPSDTDLLRFQIIAMTRQRRAHDEQLRTKQESSGFSRSIITAFNIVREGLLIFNSNYEFSFGNASAQMLLGISQSNTPDEVIAVEKLFRQLLVQHEKSTRSMKAQPGQEHPISRFETSLTRSDKRNFRASVRITTLFSTDNHPMGYAASITDLSELDQLSSSLLQSHRTRSLCLLTASSSIELLNRGFNNIILSPLTKLEAILEQHQKASAIAPILSTLMEFLDLVISPETRVKVSSKEESQVALKPADLFQLLGHMALHAVQYAGKAGEVLIEVGANIPGEGVTVVITGQSRKVTPFLQNDYLANLIQGDLSVSSHENNPSQEGKMSIGLSAAQEIAQKYRTGVEYRLSDSGKMKIRVKLPPNYKS